MNYKLCLILAVILLSGCARKSEKYPDHYAQSLETAKTVLKRNSGVDKYEKYYNARNHKAWAQSKVSGIWSFSVDYYSKESVIAEVLQRCNDHLSRQYGAITEEVSCEIINVDNEWVNE